MCVCIYISVYVCMCVYIDIYIHTYINESEGVSCSIVSNSLRPHGGLLRQWNFPYKNTGVGSHSLL